MDTQTQSPLQKEKQCAVCAMKFDGKDSLRQQELHMCTHNQENLSENSRHDLDVFNSLDINKTTPNLHSHATESSLSPTHLISRNSESKHSDTTSLQTLSIADSSSTEQNQNMTSGQDTPIPESPSLNESCPLPRDLALEINGLTPDDPPRKLLICSTLPASWAPQDLIEPSRKLPAVAQASTASASAAVISSLSASSRPFVPQSSNVHSVGVTVHPQLLPGDSCRLSVPTSGHIRSRQQRSVSDQAIRSMQSQSGIIDHNTASLANAAFAFPSLVESGQVRAYAGSAASSARTSFSVTMTSLPSSSPNYLSPTSSPGRRMSHTFSVPSGSFPSSPTSRESLSPAGSPVNISSAASSPSRSFMLPRPAKAIPSLSLGIPSFPVEIDNNPTAAKHTRHKRSYSTQSSRRQSEAPQGIDVSANQLEQQRLRDFILPADQPVNGRNRMPPSKVGPVTALKSSSKVFVPASSVIGANGSINGNGNGDNHAHHVNSISNSAAGVNNSTPKSENSESPRATIASILKETSNQSVSTSTNGWSDSSLSGGDSASISGAAGAVSTVPLVASSNSAFQPVIPRRRLSLLNTSDFIMQRNYVSQHSRDEEEDSDGETDKSSDSTSVAPSVCGSNGASNSVHRIRILTDIAPETDQERNDRLLKRALRKQQQHQDRGERNREELRERERYWRAYQGQNMSQDKGHNVSQSQQGSGLGGQSQLVHQEDIPSGMGGAQIALQPNGAPNRRYSQDSRNSEHAYLDGGDEFGGFTLDNNDDEQPGGSGRLARSGRKPQTQNQSLSGSTSDNDSEPPSPTFEISSYPRRIHMNASLPSGLPHAVVQQHRLARAAAAAANRSNGAGAGDGDESGEEHEYHRRRLHQRSVNIAQPRVSPNNSVASASGSHSNSHSNSHSVPRGFAAPSNNRSAGTSLPAPAASLNGVGLHSNRERDIQSPASDGDDEDEREHNPRHAYFDKSRKLQHDTIPSGPKRSLYKTEMCQNWVSTGQCRYGQNCFYAHGEDDLCDRVRNETFKTQPCADPARRNVGRCEYGPRCNYSHPGEAIRRLGAPGYLDSEYFSELQNDFPNHEMPFGVFI